MASKKTLNEENLTRLGVERLAGLLMEVSHGNAVIKRRLRLELAGEQGVKEIAREVRKRLITIAKASSFIDWTKRKAFLEDLQTQRRMIIDKIAVEDPTEAIDLLWQYVGIAGSVYERADDSNGYISDEFYYACAMFADIGPKAKPDPVNTAERVFGSIISNKYGEFDGLITYLGPTMGETGLEHLKSLVVDYGKKAMPKEPDREDNTIYLAGGRRGYSLDKDYARQRRDAFVRHALGEIADQQGDVDAYIAQQPSETKAVPAIAAKIAIRLLEAGRAKEALVALDATSNDRQTGWIPEEWNTTRVQVLTALGRSEEVREFHWQCFKRTLSQDNLRALLKLLPDFDDFECEQRAFDWAMSYPDVHSALGFFISWPSLEKASELILSRMDDIDGDHYEVLSPAADALQGAYPLAAILIRRAMINFSLVKARTARYKHAARHVLECQSAEKIIADYGNFADHQAFMAKLKTDHGRKISFWSLVK